MAAARTADETGRYRCSTCHQWLSPESFSRSSRYTSGRTSRCRSCTAERSRRARQEDPDRFRGYRKPRPPEVRERAKARMREKRAANPEAFRSETLRKYGITQEEYDALVAAQDGRCAICKKLPDCGKGKRLHVDHHHASGQVRALLCARCNVMIGYALESPDILRAAATYLESQ